MFCDLCVTRMVCFRLKSFSCFEYDLDLDPMTLILKLDLDMVKMYLHAKNEVFMSRGSKVIARTDRKTDRKTDRQTDRNTDRQTDRHD